MLFFFNTQAHTLPGRKVSVAGYGIRLPHIDPQGPNFIQRAQSIPDNTTDVDTKSILSTKKLEQLKEAENKVTKDKSSEEQKQPHGSLYKLSEAKLLSTGVLSKLGKLFEKVCSEKIEVTLPTDLIGNLLQNYRDLSDDAVVEKREWQTDCYKDFNTVNTLPYLTAAPEESEGEAYKSALKSVISHNQQKDKQEKKSRKIFGKKEQDSSPSKQEKRVRMSREAKGGGRGVGFKDIPKTLERPMTARSNVSSYSFRSDYSDEGRDSYMATDYDRLPAELCPTILHYHRESSSLKVKQKVPLTRREKSIEVKKKNAMDKIKKVRRELKMMEMSCYRNGLQFYYLLCLLNGKRKYISIPFCHPLSCPMYVTILILLTLIFSFYNVCFLASLVHQFKLSF